jgi:hypothetical protein
MIRPLVLPCDVHARYSLPRSDEPCPQSCHAEPSNTCTFLDQQLRERVQQIQLPFAGMKTWCCGSIGCRRLLELTIDVVLVDISKATISQQGGEKL